MPDVLTHILFAEKVRELIKDSNIRHFIGDNEKLYNLGAQGPDILFYYKPWNPFCGSIRETGEVMHHTETAKFFTEAVELLNLTKGKEYEKLLVYILGFLCHYYCDKSAHPYVYSMIEKGSFKFNGDRVKLSHYDIEAVIDTRLWNEEKRIPASKTNNAELINVEQLPDIVAEYLSQYIYKTQSSVVNEIEIKKAVQNMIRILRFFYDPKNNKKKIINKLPLPRKCYVDNGFPDVDILNLEKRVWHYPGDDKNPLEKSVGELLVEAAHDCANVANAICSHLENGEKFDFTELIPNEDYCMNKPL